LLLPSRTFENKTLDHEMQGTTPTLYGRNLTRRQFVCYLFGYLAALSFERNRHGDLIPKSAPDRFKGFWRD
jgi:hypothetical protein